MLDEIYESLKGSRINDAGELTISDFTADDYEELWSLILESIVAPSLRGKDFYHWLGAWAVRYRNQRRHTNVYYETALYDPLTQNQPDELNTRQQLAVMKFFIGRRRFSVF